MADLSRRDFCRNGEVESAFVVSFKGPHLVNSLRVTVSGTSPVLDLKQSQHWNDWKRLKGLRANGVRTNLEPLFPASVPCCGCLTLGDLSEIHRTWSWMIHNIVAKHGERNLTPRLNGQGQLRLGVQVRDIASNIVGVQVVDRV